VITWLSAGIMASGFLGNLPRSVILTLSGLPIGKTVVMKIEANLTPAQMRWLVLVILIAVGLGHEQFLELI